MPVNEPGFLPGRGLKMWQRFTERARKIIFYAQEEAQKFGEEYVSTEHILLGITREGDSRAERVLEMCGVTLAKIRTEVEKQLPRGDARPSSEMTLTPRVKRVIDLAYDEAKILADGGSISIGDEHLLLGLIREGDGLAGRVLAKLGIELARAREKVFRLDHPVGPAKPLTKIVLITEEDLRNFIVKNTQSGWALGLPNTEMDCTDGSVAIVCDDGPWKGVDRWFVFSDGSLQGDTCVIHSDSPAAVQVYHGRPTPEGREHKGDISDTLRRVLRCITPERPYRGPARYEDELNGLLYESHVEGEFGKGAANGGESISKEGVIWCEGRFTFEVRCQLVVAE